MTLRPDETSEPRADKPRHYGKLAKVGLVWGFTREWIRVLLFLPASMVLARLLSPEEAGIAATAYFFTQLGGRLTQFGFGASLVRARNITSDHVSSVFVVNLLLGVAAWAVLTSGAPAFGAFFRSPETTALLPLAALEFIIMAFGSVPTALLARDMRYRESATSEWIATVIDCSVSVGMAWLGFSFWSLIYGTLAGDVTRAVSRAWMARWWPSLKFSRPAAREMFSFGSGLYAKNLLEYATQNLDNVVVGRVLGLAALGFYDKAFQTVARFTAKVNLAGPSVSFRIFALIHEEPERFRRAYRKVILSVTLVGYPLMTGMIVAAPQLIEVLFGTRWLPAVVPFQILCGAAMLRLLNTYASTATQAKGRIWSEVRRHAMFLVVLVTSVYACSRWGIGGAAAGVLLATAVMTALLQRLIKRLAGLRWRDLIEPQIPAVVCSAGLVLVMLLARGAALAATGGLSAAPLCALLVAAAGIYYVAFLLFAPFAAVRSVVHETAQDLAPAAVARRLTWLAPAKDLPALAGR